MHDLGKCLATTHVCIGNATRLLRNHPSEEGVRGAWRDIKICELQLIIGAVFPGASDIHTRGSQPKIEWLPGKQSATRAAPQGLIAAIGQHCPRKGRHYRLWEQQASDVVVCGAIGLPQQVSAWQV